MKERTSNAAGVRQRPGDRRWVRRSLGLLLALVCGAGAYAVWPRPHRNGSVGGAVELADHSDQAVSSPGARLLAQRSVRRERWNQLREGALALAGEADTLRRRQQLDEFIAALDPGDGARLLSWSEGLSAGEGRSALVNALLTRWLEVDPDAAAQRARSLPVELLEEEVVRRVGGILLRAHPQEAAEFALTTPSASLRGELLGRALPRWAAQDRESAVEWTRNLPDGEAKQTALIHLSHQWAMSDPVGLAEYAASLPAGYEQLQGLLASRWADRDVAAAVHWVGQLPAGSGRDQATASLSGAWARAAPVEAVSYVAQLPPGAGQDWAARVVASVWADREPQAAAMWVGAFPEGPLREQVTAALISPWARMDPAGAADWVSALPAGRGRDLGISVFSVEIGDAHPEIARQWMSAISDPALRHSQLERLDRLQVEREAQGNPP